MPADSVKVSNTVGDQEVKKAIGDLLAFGQGDDSVLALRGKELAAATRANQTIEENTSIQHELDRAVSILVNETEQRMRLGIEQLTGQLDYNRTLLILAAILSLAASGAIAVLYVQRNLIRRLYSIRDAMRRLSSGDTDLDVPAVKDQDEIGEMARAVLVFRDRAVEKERLENEAAEQRRTSAQAQAMAVEEQRRTTEEQTQVVRGRSMPGSQAVRRRPTFRLTDDFPDAYEEIKDEFNLTITRLQETIEALSKATQEVSNASTDISASATDLSQRTE